MVGQGWKILVHKHLSLVTSHFFQLKSVFFSLPIFAEYSNDSDANIFVLPNEPNARIRFAAIVKPKIKTNLIVKFLDREKGIRDRDKKSFFKYFYSMAKIVSVFWLAAMRALFLAMTGNY